MASRAASTAAAVCALAGALLVVLGVSALPDPWTGGYVSEGGVASAGHSTLYRIGTAGMALAIGLLGVAMATGRYRAMATGRYRAMAAGRYRATATGTDPKLGRVRLPRWWPAPWLSLVVGSALGLVSSRVSCTRGCPLPPYQQTTSQDLVHAVASVGAVGFAALAMMTIALSAPVGRVRAIATAATAVCMPLLIALAVSIAAIGRAAVTGVLERVSLTAVALSVIASAIGVALSIAPQPRPMAAHDRRRAG